MQKHNSLWLLFGVALQRILWSANVWVISTAVLVIAILFPLGSLIVGLTDVGPYWDHIASTVLADYIANTVILVGLVVLITTLLAIPPAWFISVFDFPARGIFEWLLVLPLAIPTYVSAFVYIQISEAAIPYLVTIRELWGVETFQYTETVIRYGTLSILLSAVLYPYLYITAYASFSQQNRSVIEAAQTLGKTPTQVFFSVALPLARPAIVAGLSLIVMEVVNDYGAVNFFGVPTLTEGIFRTWFGLGDKASGVRLAGLLMLAVLTILWIERAHRGKARFTLRDWNRALLVRRRARGLSAVAIFAVCLIPLVIGLIFPTGQLIVWSIQSADTISSTLNYLEAIHSILLALGTAAALSATALLFRYTLRLYPMRWLRILIHLACLGYATPGAAVAVGVMVVLGSVDQLRWLPILLSGTLPAIVFAYHVRFLAVPFQSISAGMTRICGSLDEASRTLRHGPFSTLWWINLPLLRGTLAAVTMLVFVDILKELPLTMLLRPANFDTLAVTAFGLAKEGRIYECAIPSLLIVCAGAGGLVILNYLLKRDS